MPASHLVQPNRYVLLLVKALAAASGIMAVVLLGTLVRRGELLDLNNLTALAILVYNAPVMWVLGAYPDERPAWARLLVSARLHESWKNDCVYAARRSTQRNGLTNLLWASLPSFLCTLAGLFYGFFASLAALLVGWALWYLLHSRS